MFVEGRGGGGGIDFCFIREKAILYLDIETHFAGIYFMSIRYWISRFFSDGGRIILYRWTVSVSVVFNISFGYVFVLLFLNTRL